MHQIDAAFWIFISLTLLFLGFQAIENYVASREFKSPELPFLMLAIFCGFMAFAFHLYEVT